MTKDQKINHFAIVCFRDMADADYIAARTAHRANIAAQFLWASEQALEKYLKCILVLNRVECRIGHELAPALERIQKHLVDIPLSARTTEFIKQIDIFGKDRYLAASIPHVRREHRVAGSGCLGITPLLCAV